MNVDKTLFQESQFASGNKGEFAAKKKGKVTTSSGKVEAILFGIVQNNYLSLFGKGLNYFTV